MNERLAITRRVMKAMRHESNRTPLLRTDRGGLQLIVCLDTDTVASAASRVRDAGGKATVMLPAGEYIIPLNWSVVPTSSDEALFEADSEGPIHPESTLGMLAEYLDTCGGEHTFRISAEGAQLSIEEGERLTVPA